ncbi:MAG: phosphodiester glycosidase family protein [Sandaracinaceae bacterium]
MTASHRATRAQDQRRALAALAGAVVLGSVAAAAQVEEHPASEPSSVIVERVRAPIAPEVPVGDRVITIVRVRLDRYRLRILTEEHDGPRRSVPSWVRELNLAGAINAGMFLPNGRSVGHMIRDGSVVSRRRVGRYRGVVGFGPRRGGLPALTVSGPDCGQTVDSLAARYENVLQALPMVNCRGEARRWSTRKRYSAAGFGVDAAGRAVFMHVRTPYRMSVLDRMLADPSLRIRSMIYMEGGPEASLVVRDGDVRVEELGSYETDFNENDDNRHFWEVPNVIGFVRR